VIRISLEVNGAACEGAVEPRMHLADFLRQQVGLTGTHLGCEQGVCGACTLLIDGQPMRSCLSYAVSCDGSRVQTIEGFDADALMAELREAFSVHHGLQCGFCTPAMLITARDIILRFGDADEAVIRRELSGNICRCTGYMGIVAAIRAVAKGRQPVSAGQPAPVVSKAAPLPKDKPTPVAAPKAVAMAAAPGGPELRQSITIAAPPADVWAALADITRVGGCLPGAVIDSVDGNDVRGHLTVKFGPIRARFAGEAKVERDETEMRGRIIGGGRDAHGGSSARGMVTYSLRPVESGMTAIDLAISYQLTGALAQFGRSELVADFAGRMATAFAQNLSAMLQGGGAAPAGTADINIVALGWSLLLARLRRLFGVQ
jgi:carbon-monoxide dehydrogenase small subunit